MPDQTGVPLGPPSPPPPPPPPAYRPPGPPDPARPRGPRLGVVLALVAALVLIVAAGVTGLVLALPGSDGAAPQHHAPAAHGGPDTAAIPTGGPTHPTTSTAVSGITDADRASAVSFAQSSLPTVLGYSADSYDAHVRSAAALMTPAYAASYRTTSSGIRAVVVQQHAAVTARVLETGLGGIGADSAQVLAFVDQTARRSGGSRQLITAWVSVSLERSGTGWLISGLATGTSPTPAAAEPDPERRAAVDAARRVVSALLSVDYRHPDRSRGQVLALTTGTLAQQYRSSSATLARSLARSHTLRTVQVRATGVSAFADGSAQVLLAATSRVTSRAGSQSQDDRIRMTLTRVDGTWLATDLAFVS